MILEREMLLDGIPCLTRLVTAPAVEPVSIAEAKKQLRIETVYSANTSAEMTVTSGSGAIRDTIVRASGSFVADGFVDGMTGFFDGVGSGANNGRYFIIHTVAALTLTLTTIGTTVAVTPAAAFVVRAGWSFDADDAYLASLIKGARQACENMTNRRFITQTHDAYYYGWPECGRFKVPFGRLQSVTSITYQPETGDAQTLDASDYVVDTASEPGCVYLAPGADWPSDDLRQGLPVTIRFVCGYGSTGAAMAEEEGIIMAMLKLVADHYEQRQDIVISSMQTHDLKLITWLLKDYRIFTR